MRRFIVILAVALLVGAVAVTQVEAQTQQHNWTRDVMVFAGSDSLYQAPGAVADTRDSTAIAVTYTGGASVRFAYTNWLDISQLAYPPFVESYLDTNVVVSTVATTQTVTSGGSLIAGNGNAVSDSLVAGTGTYTNAQSELPSVFSLTLTNAMAAALDSIYVTAQVSNDKLGWRVVGSALLDPAEATAAVMAEDAFELDGGKLWGWKYLRFRIQNSDYSNVGAIRVTPVHVYRTSAISDWSHRAVRMIAK